MKQKINKKTGIFLLAVIIIIELIYTTFTFVYKKEGTHSDEMWTYSSANSYYKPNFYIKKNGNVYRYESEDFDNLNEWIPGKKLHDYITVQKGERFAYDSVYSNLKTDLHPPLYYMAVHTICSLFPDKFSFWYAYILNVFALIFTQIYLYKLVMLISKDHSPTIALLSCLLYGGGVGALETFIFLRMYAWAAALVTAHIYYQFRLFLSEDFNIKKNIFPIALTGLLGLLTHNLYAVIMGICTACICLWLLFKKKIKKMFVYGFSMVATLCIFFLIFPSALNQILGRFGIIQNTGEKKAIYPFSYNLCDYLNYTFQNTLGIKIKFFDIPPEISLVFTIIGMLIILALPVCFLFRKKPFFVKIKTKILKFKEKISKINLPMLFLLVIVLGFSIVLAKSVDAEIMGKYASRYVMPIYPLICAFAILLFKYIFGIIPKIKKHIPCACTVFTVLILALVNFTVYNPFLNVNPKDHIDVSNLIKNQKCEAVIRSPWLMTCYQSTLMNCSQVKFTLAHNFYDFKKQTVNIDGIDKGETMYLMLSKDACNVSDESTAKELSAGGYKTYFSEKDAVKSIEKNPKVNSIKLLGHINIQDEPVAVYKIN